MKNVKMWKIESLNFAENNQEIIDFPHLSKEMNIDSDDLSDIDSFDI
jgi:hypothetical protein